MFKGFVREGELRRWAPWATAVLLVLLAVALETGMEAVCWDQKSADAAKINEAAGCFEFWSNRYQTLIGALAALVAGYAAWRGAMNQVAKADAQIALVAQQLAFDRIDAINEKLSAITSLHNAITRFQLLNDQAVNAMKSIIIGAEEICRAIDEGRHPAVYYNNLIVPETKEFDTCISTMQALSIAINKFQDNVNIPDIVRNWLPIILIDIASRNHALEGYSQRIKTGISINSLSTTPIQKEYKRIALVRNDMPRRFQILEHAIFLNVRAECDRLEELRRSAENAAGI